MKRKNLVLAFLLIVVSVLVSCTPGGNVTDVSENPSEVVSESVSETKEEVSEDLSEQTSTVAEQEEVESEKESEEALSENSSEEFNVTPASGNYYAGKSVNVRSGPSTDYDILTTLNKDDKIVVNGVADNGWYRFDMNGKEAFISNTLVVDEETYLINKQAEQDALEASVAEAAAQEAQKAAQERAAQEAAAAQQAVASSGNAKADVVAIINQERANNGLAGVASDPTLDALAQIRAQEIYSSFSHTRPDGRTCFSVFEDNGYAYMAAGENIAAGYMSAADVMQGWMESSGHRANILNGSFGKVGIGLYIVPGDAYSYYWVQLFTN